MEQDESNKHKQVCHNKQNSEYLRSFPGRGMFKQQSFFDLTFCSFWYAFSSAILSENDLSVLPRSSVPDRVSHRQKWESCSLVSSRLVPQQPAVTAGGWDGQRTSQLCSF